MKRIGAHVSAAGGVHLAPMNAHAIKARAFALFTRNQRQWASRSLTGEDIRLFNENIGRYGYKTEHILPHDSYLINLGTPDPVKRKKSLQSFRDEMNRCRLLGLKYLNFHPGSHLNLISLEKCLDLIAEALNSAISQIPDVMPLIENTAGQGTNVGSSFEEINGIIQRIKDQSRIGVCVDTCHAFAAGYDLASAKGYRQTWKRFDTVVGSHYLKALHLNDAKKPLNSRVDRHACIGEGEIGIESFRRIMRDDRFDEMPLILETPEPDRWPHEIKLLYSMA